jgi:hypothetical protein
MNTIKKQEKEEQLLKENGFRKVYLPDDSGYWWQKNMNKTFAYYVDPETSFLQYDLCVITLEGHVEVMKKFKTLKALLRSKEKFTVIY